MSAMAIPRELQCFVVLIVTNAVKNLPDAGVKRPDASSGHPHVNARNLSKIADNRRLLQHVCVAQLLRFKKDKTSGHRSAR
jgi:hypothetical protein